MSRALDLLDHVAKQGRYRGSWSEDVYQQCGRTIARYSYRLGAGELLGAANGAQRDGADILRRAGFKVEIRIGSQDVSGSRDLFVVGEADDAPLDREVFIAAARRQRIADEAANPQPAGLPNAKSPGGPERREAAKQMEAEAQAWARRVRPENRTTRHRELTERLLDPEQDHVKVGVYLAALVAVMSEAKRWVETDEEPKSGTRRAA